LGFSAHAFSDAAARRRFQTFSGFFNNLLGPDYTVLGSTNLFDWVPLLSTNPPIMPFLFTEPNNTNYDRRFYRVLLGP
jgi:hypothetical protein